MQTQWHSPGKTLIIQLEKHHIYLPMCSISSSNMLMSFFFSFSGNEVVLKCATDVIQTLPRTELQLFPSLLHPTGVHHHYQNKLLLTARVIFPLLLPLRTSHINIFVEGKCVLQEASPMCFFQTSCCFSGHSQVH